MNEILITGASGFVGIHLTHILMSDHQVISLANHQGGEYVYADITNKDQLKTVIEKYRAPSIIHLAAIAATWKDWDDLYRVNVLGTQNLYEGVSSIEGYQPKIILASSGVVYGNTPRPEDITEDAPTVPVNPYGKSKYQAECLSQEFVQGGMDINIVRCFNMAGSGQGLGFFVPDMCKQIVDIERGELDSGEILVGHLGATRDILDVRDAVQAYKILINSDIKPGEVFNICSGVGHKMEKVLDILISLSTKNILTKQDPKRMQRSETPIFVGNNTKLKSLGWQAQYSLEQTLRDALNYWRSID